MLCQAQRDWPPQRHGDGSERALPGLPPPSLPSLARRGLLFSLSRDKEPEKETGREAEGRAFHPRWLPRKPAPGVSSSGLSRRPQPPRTQSQGAGAERGQGAAGAQLCWHRQEWHFRGGSCAQAAAGQCPSPVTCSEDTGAGRMAACRPGGQTSTRESPQALRHSRDSTSVQGCSGRVAAPRSTCLPGSVLTWLHSGSSGKSTEGWAPGRLACGRALLVSPLGHPVLSGPCP